MNADPVQKLRNEYATLAPIYDQKWAKYLSPINRKTLEFLPDLAGKVILDVGCGTGQLLEIVANQFPTTKLTGIDISPEMLAIAKSRVPAGTQLLEATAAQLPFPDEVMDVVVCNSALHYFTDPIRCLNEIKRVLKPGGTLVLSDWCHDYLVCRCCAAFLRLTNRYFHRIYRVKELQAMLREVGLVAGKQECYRLSLVWGMMTIAATKPHREMA